MLTTASGFLLNNRAQWDKIPHRARWHNVTYDRNMRSSEIIQIYFNQIWGKYSTLSTQLTNNGKKQKKLEMYKTEHKISQGR